MSKGLNIKMALLEHNEKHPPKTQGEIARVVYPELSQPDAKVSLVISGATKVSRAEVLAFCHELKCDANKLFNEI